MIKVKEYEYKSCRFVYDPHSNILWCQIPKTGSTTYIDAYNKIARMYGKGNYGRLGKLHSDRERVKKMLSFNDGNKDKILARNPLIFSVVRHPYERLVSAYADFTDKPRSKNEFHGTFQVELNENNSRPGFPERASAGKERRLQPGCLLSNQPTLEFPKQPLLLLRTQLYWDLEDGNLC